jgi:hypothetical protein
MDDKPLPRSRVNAIDPVTPADVFAFVGATPPRAEVYGDLLLGGGEVLCATDSSFVVRGLLPRSYRLHAQEPSALLSNDTDPIPAGRPDVTIQLGTKNTYPCLAGRLVYTDGTPAANLRVQGRETTPKGAAMADETRSDSAGQFRIAMLSRDAESLAVLPEAAPVRMYRIADFPDPCALVLVVPRNGDIRIETTGTASTANQFAVLDARGTRLSMARHYQDGWQGPWELMPIENGKTGWIIAPDDAVTIVLLKGDKELIRSPIRVRAGEMTVVRL